jgi:uncharacterized membrane protein YoaK (UPF0700 family)
MPDTLQPSRWLSLGLTFVDGYGDAVGFGHTRTFTGMEIALKSGSDVRQEGLM